MYVDNEKIKRCYVDDMKPNQMYYNGEIIFDKYPRYKTFVIDILSAKGSQYVGINRLYFINDSAYVTPSAGQLECDVTSRYSSSYRIEKIFSNKGSWYSRWLKIRNRIIISPIDTGVMFNKIKIITASSSHSPKEIKIYGCSYKTDSTTVDEDIDKMDLLLHIPKLKSKQIYDLSEKIKLIS